MSVVILNNEKTGSKGCNTDPAKCKILDDKIKLVNLFVDSLYISFTGELKEGVLEYFEAMKKEAQREDAPRLAYEFYDKPLIIQPFGTKGYSYLLDGEDFSIKIGGGNVGPCVYAEIRAHYIYGVGYKAACYNVMTVIEQFIEKGQFIVSRIDLCADVVGWEPNKNLNDLVVTRARKKQIFFDGNEITGFNFGFGGDISCRIYNKSLQAKEKKIRWLQEIWNNNGYSENMGDVWRIEFQLKREILKQFNLSNPDEVFSSLNSIWKYCTQDWFTIKIKGTDNTKSRWNIQNWWKSLSKLEFNSFGTEVVRKIHKDTHFEKIIDGLLAYQTSIAAYFNIYEQKDASKIGDRFAETRLRERNKNFEEIVIEKRKRKGFV